MYLCYRVPPKPARLFLMPLPQLRLPRKRLPIQPVPVAHRRNGVLRGLRGRPVQRDRTEPAALPGAHRRHQMVKKNTVAARRERVTGVGFTFCILTSYSFAVFSMTIHPNKLLVATGQTAGHDNREGKVNDKRLFFRRVTSLVVNLTVADSWEKAWVGVIGL